jgi:hypothetical protein
MYESSNPRKPLSHRKSEKGNINVMPSQIETRSGRYKKRTGEKFKNILPVNSHWVVIERRITHGPVTSYGLWRSVNS